MKKKQKLVIIILCIMFIVSMFLLSYKTIYAYSFTFGPSTINLSPSVPFEEGEAGVDKGFGRIFDIIIIVSGIIFTILFLIGGVIYLTAMGNDEQVTKARKLLLDAIIGLVIVLGAWAGSNWIYKAIEQGPTVTPVTPTSPAPTSPTTTVPTSTPPTPTTTVPTSPPPPPTSPFPD